MLDGGWTDEKVELLKRLWADGLSASQIAAELPGSLTRNSIIGKVHRLGLDKRGNTSTPRATRPPVKPKPARYRANVPLGEPLPPLELEPPPPEDLATPQDQRRTLLQLTNSTCRWPIGEVGTPQFFFCGALGADFSGNRPYCPHHHRGAYDGIPTRRPRREATFGFYKTKPPTGEHDDGQEHAENQA